MKTIPEYVEEIVLKSSIVMGVLEQDILNLSAYARLIKPLVQEQTLKRVTEASIIMALKRLQTKLQKQTVSFENAVGEIIVRSSLYEITFPKSIFTKENIAQFSTFMDQHPNDLIIITNGIFETTVIFPEKYRKSLSTVLQLDKIISEAAGLSALIIRLKEDKIVQPGLYYHLLQPLALNGVPIVEVASTYSELTVLVEDKYIEEAFTLLKLLTRTKSEK